MFRYCTIWFDWFFKIKEETGNFFPFFVVPAPTLLSLLLLYIPAPTYCPCPYFISMSLLYVPVPTLCPCPYFISLPLLIVPVPNLYPCPYFMSLSLLYVPVPILFPCPYFRSLFLLYVRVKGRGIIKVKLTVMMNKIFNHNTSSLILHLSNHFIQSCTEHSRPNLTGLGISKMGSSFFASLKFFW